ncbi:hypothetical protein A4X13_0g7065 [Tilletia indica]|uniref:Uncharacterized protein n=1 Tax=Tilletia indica TaxID=43049 RepID=A0A8T8SKL7_9BASI|nr:hypothetical protein A4X13_0g7065 [Tilletia indica]
MRVEIWANGDGKSNKSWSISKHVRARSPSRPPQETCRASRICSSSSPTSLALPIVMALKIRMKDGVKHVGAAYADASNRMICSATRK